MATVQFQEKTIVVNKLFLPPSHRRLLSSLLPIRTIFPITILFFINIYQFRLKIKFRVLTSRILEDI